MSHKRDWRKAPRNVYSTDFKMRMVELALQPWASVSAIAREHGFNDNLLFKWLRLWQKEGHFSHKAAKPTSPVSETASLMPVGILVPVA